MSEGYCLNDLNNALPVRDIIVERNMAARACVLLCLICACACAARECIELTMKSDLLSESIFNGTVFKVHNQSYVESEKLNILELWDRFPRIMVPMNGTSEQCRRDSRLFLDSLDRLELWALKSNYLFFFFLINISNI